MDLHGAEVHLLDYWPALLRRRWVILLCVVSCALVALMMSLATTPSYRATATVQIERQNPDIFTFQDLSRIDYSWAAYNDFYQTQYKIIASHGVALAAVQRGPLMAHPAFDTRPSSPGLLARARALLLGPPEEVTADPIKTAAATVLANLEVAPIRDSHLVQISWLSDDPQLAALVANQVATAYIEDNLSSQFTTNSQAGAFLLDQVVSVKQEIRKLETTLQEYGEEKRIVSIDDANNTTLQSLKDIAVRLTAAETMLTRERAAWTAVTEAPADALPEVRNSALISRLREEYAGYEATYSELSRRFKPEWPSAQTAAYKLEQARARLTLEVERIAGQVRASFESRYRSVESEVDALRALLRSRETAAQRLKRDTVDYSYLQGEVRKKRETLNALMARQNEMTLSTALKDLDANTSSNIRVMEFAVPPSAPFRPRTSRNLGLGLLLGLSLGLVLALLLDQLDNTIGSVAELKRVLALPVLAVIPRHGALVGGRARRRATVTAAETVDLIAHRESRAAASEAYRELRTSIMLSSAGRQPKLLMVTSALPEEGKTSTAINIAVVLAQLGRRVLLVDTDLRRPRLHRAFGVSNRAGVSTYLSGQADRPQTLAHATSVDGLSLLTSGPIPPNPSELLDSEVFVRMSRELLESGFEHLVFDSPPSLSAPDSLIIAQIADSRILVVRAHRTARQSIRAAAEKLSQAAEGPLGVVLNGLDPDRIGNRHQYYGRYGDPEEVEATQPAQRAGSETA